MSKKKIIVKLELHDGKDKQKTMKAVAAIVGIDSISVDLASKKMTVIGTVDPVKLVSKLRKAQYPATLISIAPHPPPPPPEKKEEKKEGEGEKKDGEKKDGEKKDGEKKDGEKKEGEGEKKDEKKDGEKKDEKKEEKKPTTEQQILAELLNQYRAYNPYPPYHPYMAPPPPPPPHYYVHNMSMEENPNSCVIC